MDGSSSVIPRTPTMCQVFPQPLSIPPAHLFYTSPHTASPPVTTPACRFRNGASASALDGNVRRSHDRDTTTMTTTKDNDYTPAPWAQRDRCLSTRPAVIAELIAALASDPRTVGRLARVQR